MQGQQGELSVTYRMTCKGENPFTTMRRIYKAINDLVRRHGGGIFGAGKQGIH